VNGIAAFGNEAYSAAKAGLINLTRNLALRYGPRGVRFNVVAPGTVRSPIWDQRLAARPGLLDRIENLYPLRRVGVPDDIAAACVFLASPDASWITGQTLAVDGGVTVAVVYHAAQDFRPRNPVSRIAGRPAGAHYFPPNRGRRFLVLGSWEWKESPA
jgi:enoyl-[acyl-carrier-protein] reductase (NADH)